MWATDNNIKVEAKGGDNNWTIKVKRKDGIDKKENKTINDVIEKKDKILPEEDLLIKDKDSVDEDIFNFFWWKFWLSIIACFGWFFILLIISFNNVETPAEKIQRIKDQVSEVQQENISLAEIELVRLDWVREVQLNNLSSTQNDILIYQNCIILNQTQELPVDCSTITLSLKQQLKWKVNSNWFSQEFKELKNQWVIGRTQELLELYTHTNWTYDLWAKYEKMYWIKMQVAIAIAKADSSLWDEMKSLNNVGNVGNNDRWDTWEYLTKEDWIEAIYRTLNNKYLWHIYNIGYLSEWGRTVLGGASCTVKGEFCYATSEENWNINVINTLRLLYQDASIDETFEFRI